MVVCIALDWYWYVGCLERSCMVVCIALNWYWYAGCLERSLPALIYSGEQGYIEF
jgi:hypothetical protein